MDFSLQVLKFVSFAVRRNNRRDIRTFATIRQDEQQLLQVIIYIIFLISAVMACGGAGQNASSGTPAQNQAKAENKSEENTVSNETPDAVKTQKARQLRRAHIALIHSLPDLDLVDGYLAGSFSLSEHLNNLINSQPFTQALGSELIEVWHLGLEYAQGINNQDSGPITGFDGATASSIQGELEKTIYFHLQQNTPYSAWFSQNYSVMHDDLLEDANFTAIRQLYPGDKFNLGVYADDRFQAGFLTSNGMRLVSDRNRLMDSAAAASKILQTFYCSNHDQVNAHNFIGMSSEDFGQLEVLSTSAGHCAQCHVDNLNLATHLPFASGETNKTEWLKIATPSEFQAGSLFSRRFTNTTELRNILASDQRIGTCLINNLVQIYMRREPIHDDQPLLSGLHAIYDQHQQIRDLVLSLVLDEKFYIGADSQALARSSTLKARVLSRLQFKDILKNLMPDLSLAEPSPTMLPPYNGTRLKDKPEFSYSDLLYFRYYAQQFADQIIEKELDLNSTSATRHLLHLLSDGLPLQSDSSIIDEQIIALNRQLTSQTLKADSVRLVALKKLWTSQARTAEAGFKAGWKAILMGILLSPDFLIY